MYSLYFHIPFCIRKCDYCHFFVVPNELRFHDPFMKALRQQWLLRQSRVPATDLCSIYLGGGTPSLLSIDHLASLLSWIQPSPNVEVTLEVNPESISADIVRQWMGIGINRLSFGVQSFDNTLLQHLSRRHTKEAAKVAIEAAYQGGCSNISLDLMYDIHGQSMESWKETLQEAIALPISHLSLYNLTIEPHTVFYKYRNRLPAIDPDLSLSLLQTAVEMLEYGGFPRYEISAFGRPSQHNIGYWTNRPFLGYGPSAWSDWEGCRFQNTPNFWKFIRELGQGIDPISEEETLGIEARERERVAIGLRLFTGVETDLDLAPLVKEGLLLQDGRHYWLSEQGKLLYDEIATHIV